MKTTNLTMILAAGLLPMTALAQPSPPPAPPSGSGQYNPATPPVAPVPPQPPGDRDHDRGEKAPKVPVTYLGVETSSVPTVVSEQLGLAKGFGLVVDYVVPNGPAAAAGVQQNDILKNLNEQILVEPDQLSKLIRSFPEGTSVTLTVLRKGAETKLTAKLGKREVSQRRGWNGRGPNFGGINMGDFDMENFHEQMDNMKEQMGNMHVGMSEEDREQMREQIRQAQETAREGARAAREGARMAAREGARAAREAARAAREMKFAQRENGAVKTTRIDLGKAQIVYHDQQGELKIESIDNKKVLTAKDSDGRLIFSGPVETKEELDKLPPDVRQRYDKLEQKDLPNVVPPSVVSRDDDNDSGDETADEDSDSDDNDANDEDDSETSEAVLQVSFENVKSVPYRHFGINTVSL